MSILSKAPSRSENVTVHYYHFPMERQRNKEEKEVEEEEEESTALVRGARDATGLDFWKEGKKKTNSY